MRRPRFIAKQARHARGLLGRLIAFIMSRETWIENQRAIEALGIEESDHVLDIGCGPGRGLAALAVVGRDSDLSILALLAAAILSGLIGLFLYSQGWIWGSRMARRRQGGQSILVAIGGGLMALLAAIALAGLLILTLLFYLG